MNEETKCFFANTACECSILKDVRCDGFKNDCNFHKTFTEYITDRNRAIKINQQKGNCAKCNYVNVKCNIIKIEQ